MPFPVTLCDMDDLISALEACRPRPERIPDSLDGSGHSASDPVADLDRLIDVLIEHLTPAGPTRLTDEQRSEVVRLIEHDGLGKAAAARRFGVSRQTIYRILDAKGMPDPPVDLDAVRRKAREALEQ